MNTKAHQKVVGVQNAGGKANRKATGLYYKQEIYLELWNRWHPFWSAHDFHVVGSPLIAMRVDVDS